MFFLIFGNNFVENADVLLPLFPLVQVDLNPINS